MIRPYVNGEVLSFLVRTCPLLHRVVLSGCDNLRGEHLRCLAQLRAFDSIVWVDEGDRMDDVRTMCVLRAF